MAERSCSLLLGATTLRLWQLSHSGRKAIELWCSTLECGICHGKSFPALGDDFQRQVAVTHQD
ncbi:hypothetical protein CaCOL14_002294 [Colletotrichum acutatum]